MVTQVIEQTGVAITTRGNFYAKDAKVPPGERKLYIVIEAETKAAVDTAKKSIRDTIITAEAAIIEENERKGGGPSRYSVI